MTRQRSVESGLSHWLANVRNGPTGAAQAHAPCVKSSSPVSRKILIPREARQAVGRARTNSFACRSPEGTSPHPHPACRRIRNCSSCLLSRAFRESTGDSAPFPRCSTRFHGSSANDSLYQSGSSLHSSSARSFRAPGAARSVPARSARPRCYRCSRATRKAKTLQAGLVVE